MILRTISKLRPARLRFRQSKMHTLPHLRHQTPTPSIEGIPKRLRLSVTPHVKR